MTSTPARRHHGGGATSRDSSSWRRVSASALLIFVLAGLLGVVSAPRAAADGDLDRAAVDRFVTEYLERNGLPGAEVAVIRDGRPIYRTGLGSGVTADTPMAIGSVSKLITAFAVLQLVDAGRIGLDDEVVRDLPELHLDDPRAGAITVRDLLSHTSGLPNPIVVPQAGSLRERVAQLRTTSLSSTPGTTYAYSNLGYQVAARLVEVVSGQSFGRYLDEHVFGPLGMLDTHAVATLSGDDPGLRDGHVTAYGLAVPLREMPSMSAGSGGVISTAHDMARWLAMVQRGGVTADGTRLLSAQLIEEALTRQPNAGSTGLGWQHTQTSVPARIGKDGTLTRYSARIDLVPSSGYGVVVLLNSYTPTMKHPFEISSGIIAITEGQSPAPGAPVATIIDDILAVITLVVIAMTVRGLLRARVWSAHRRHRPRWWFTLRLVPQLIAPAAAALVFLVLPQVEDNVATPVDAFGLWPAAMVLLLITALAGISLTAKRIVLVVARDSTTGLQPPHSDHGSQERRGRSSSTASQL